MAYIRNRNQHDFLPPAADHQNFAAGRQGSRQRRGGGHRRPSLNLCPLVPPGTPFECKDPLWTPNCAGFKLTPMPNVRYIYSGAEALPQVVSVIHASCVASSSSYGRRVPKSALSYYCAVATYARMLHLQRSNGLSLSADEGCFVEQVGSLSLKLPMLLALYLAGFGNTRVPSGRDIRFAMRARSYVAAPATCSGWFGRVSDETQPLYQNYPCLGLAAARVLNDISDTAYVREWNIPAELRSRQVGIGPSTAMIGFDFRARLTNSQREFVEAAGVYSDLPFPSVNPELPLSVALMSLAQRELLNVAALKFSNATESIVGSQAQLGLVHIEDELAGRVEKTAVLESAFQLPPEIAFPASAFCYRINHDVDKLPENVVAPWVVWRYEQAEADAWMDIANVGNVFRGAEPDILRSREFRTTPYLIISNLSLLEQQESIMYS